MARPREFDVDTAIANAMDVFWAHGYEETSLPQLLKGMSLSRGSLYKAFSDKRSLFMTVLEKYERDAVAPTVSLLCDANIPDGAERIQIVFGKILDAVNSGDHRGCLLCTAAAGSAPNDEEIAVVVHGMLDQMRHGFETAVEHTFAFAECDASTRAKVKDLLLTQYVGLRVLARSRAPITMLEEALASLEYILTGSTHPKIAQQR